MPFFPSSGELSAPVYTVDLVGGEKIGGNNLGTELIASSAVKSAPKRTAEDVPPPALESKPEPKPEPKVEKSKAAAVLEKEPSAPEKVVLQDTTKKEPIKKEPNKETKIQSKTDESALDRVRERLIQSAVDRAKSRVEETQSASRGAVISAGPGEGEGAAALGSGGRGGGVVKGIEFIVYQNRMLSSIKDNWAWVGQRSNLKVVVHFSIRDNGEITNLKIIQSSGDSSYDESVLRAVKKSSPLPPPPESARRDFADVELTFRPKDLGA
jgi:colicin import membrane protein